MLTKTEQWKGRQSKNFCLHNYLPHPPSSLSLSLSLSVTLLPPSPPLSFFLCSPERSSDTGSQQHPNAEDRADDGTDPLVAVRVVAGRRGQQKTDGPDAGETGGAGGGDGQVVQVKAVSPLTACTAGQPDEGEEVAVRLADTHWRAVAVGVTSAARLREKTPQEKNVWSFFEAVSLSPLSPLVFVSLLNV